MENTNDLMAGVREVNIYKRNNLLRESLRHI